MSTTLLQLRDDCKDRCDMSGSAQTGGTDDAFIPNSTFNQYINASLAEFHDLVVQKDVMFFVTSSQATVTNSSNLIPLPADFQAMKGFERSLGSTGNNATWYNIDKFSFKDRNFGNNTYLSAWLPPFVRYCIVGNNIMLMPPNAAAGLYQMWYYPTAPVLDNDSDTFDDQRYWYEYVVCDVARKALEKEESFEAAQVQAQRKAELLLRIETMSADRDYGSPLQVGQRAMRGSGWGGGGFGW